ncbi:MAG: GNAT family N-acetyltransferase [Mycoplasmataceae bacterium]|jgi:ribosomal-protein-alanine N-acetyltransferase|nr:GNAT family N-acetyltransferase [Mycoplasmataceae bacterium]
MIKVLTIQDVPKISEYEQFEHDCLTMDQLMNMLSNKSYCNLGVFINDQLISYLFTATTKGEIDIVKIFTAEAYRQKGFAIKLLAFLESKYPKHILYLEVNELNKPAINLYHKLGFQQINVRKKYYNNINDAIIMERKIQ